MTLQEAILQAEQLAFEGQDYNYIKRKLKSKLRNPEEVKELLRAADDAIVNYELAKQARGRFLGLFIGGLLIFGFGIVVTWYSYASSSGDFILAYGAILAGLGLVITGYTNFRQPLQALAPRRTLFAHKRNYKKI